jgi:L-lactate dehydrogenase (cytochrome)
MQHGDGEILACRAAQKAGIPFCLSTMSICSIEDVAAAVEKPFWFQAYVMRDRGFTQALIERAAAAQCSALVLTVDMQVLAQRHCDIRNGLSVPPEVKLKNLFDILTKPAWAMSVLRGKRKTFGNLVGYIPDQGNLSSIAYWVSSQIDPGLTWKEVEWIRSLWPGKLILKGIFNVDDAKIAAKTGATALVVSNHGGRQLDGTSSAISMLPAIADAVGSEIELLFDSGIRSGQDVMRALALGARSCLIGRSYVYGLGAGGEKGVSRAIDILRRELDVTMVLTGINRIEEIGRQVIVLGGGNTAMDCCRTARRLGGSEVKVIVRSPFSEMKASPWEKEDAQHEDIPIIDNHVPKSFVVEGGILKGMTFEKVRVERENGRRKLVPTGEPDVFYPADDVLVAIGQENSFPWIERGIGLDFDEWDMPVVDPVTFVSTHPRVFFGGDAAFGPKNVITAVAHGHQAAISIDLFCQGKALSERPASERGGGGHS